MQHVASGSSRLLASAAGLALAAMLSGCMDDVIPVQPVAYGAAPPPYYPDQSGYYDQSGGYGDQAGDYAGQDQPVMADTAPPPIPAYEQPPIPGPGYIWTPGYWAWNNGGYGDGYGGYYWVPGAWALPPSPGLLWTPGYWGWSGGGFLFHAGYWGVQVGFYGGIDYGFGYGGHGFDGCEWDHDHYRYNRAVANVNNGNIDSNNIYNRTVVNNITNNYTNNTTNIRAVSYNGGPGGVAARPDADQLALARQQRYGATRQQQWHMQTSAGNQAAFASINHGAPPVAAVQRLAPAGSQPSAPARAATPNGWANRSPWQADQAGQQGGNGRPAMQQGMAPQGWRGRAAPAQPYQGQAYQGQAYQGQAFQGQYGANGAGRGNVDTNVNAAANPYRQPMNAPRGNAPSPRQSEQQGGGPQAYWQQQRAPSAAPSPMPWRNPGAGGFNGQPRGWAAPQAQMPVQVRPQMQFRPQAMPHPVNQVPVRQAPVNQAPMSQPMPRQPQPAARPQPQATPRQDRDRH